MAATQENKQQVKEIFALWKKESKRGTGSYFTGTSRTKCNLIAFYNTNKKNPNEPDLRIYAKDEEGKTGDEVASLWVNVSEKTGSKYLTGYCATFKDVKITGFINKDTKDGKYPYIRVYLKSELDASKSAEKPVQAKEEPKKEEVKQKPKVDLF